MDISCVFGKSCPQKVTLDCNIVTVSGELIPKNTDIFVFISGQLVTCNTLTRHKNVYQKLYLNVASKADFKDIHCDGKIHRTIDDLCHDSPRYFCCTDAVFAFDYEHDQTVKIEAKQELELPSKENKGCVTSCDEISPIYTNIKPKSSNIVRCVLRTGEEIRIPPSCKTSFKCLPDTNNYKAEDLLRRFNLPRHVQLYDQDIANLASVVIGSKDIELQSQTKTFVLLFTLNYENSDQIQSSCEHIKEGIKCCEFMDPKTIKIKRRLDNTQIGEHFDSTFCLEREEKGKKMFSILGRRNYVPISRLCSGRQEYIAMDGQGSLKAPHSKNDSGFVEADHKSHTFPKTNTKSNENLSSSSDSDEYVDISLDVERVPRIPEKTYLDEVPKTCKAEVTAAHLTDTDNKSTETMETDKKSIDTDTKSLDAKDNLLDTKDKSLDTERNLKIDALSEKHVLSQTEEEEKSKEDPANCEISCMSVIQLAELLKKCKLNKLAEICVEELVDGDLFLGLTEDVMEEEPFNLKKFEILKVNKIKRGWKPNL